MVEKDLPLSTCFPYPNGAASSDETWWPAVPCNFPSSKCQWNSMHVWDRPLEHPVIVTGWKPSKPSCRPHFVLQSSLFIWTKGVLHHATTLLVRFCLPGLTTPETQESISKLLWWRGNSLDSRLTRGWKKRHILYWRIKKKICLVKMLNDYAEGSKENRSNQTKGEQTCFQLIPLMSCSCFRHVVQSSPLLVFLLICLLSLHAVWLKRSGTLWI